MITTPGEQWVLICTVVNFGVGSKVMTILEEKESRGHHLLAKAQLRITVRNTGFTDIRKEIVLNVTVPSSHRHWKPQ